MKASAFPRIYRAYDLEEKKMYSPEALAKAGFTVAPDGLPSNASKPLFNIVLMWYSGRTDDSGKKIFESDICKIGILNDFGSLTIDYGIMKWDKLRCTFMLLIPSAVANMELKIQSVVLLGNEFENPELVPLVNNEQLIEKSNG